MNVATFDVLRIISASDSIVILLRALNLLLKLIPASLFPKATLNIFVLVVEKELQNCAVVEESNGLYYLRMQTNSFEVACTHQPNEATNPFSLLCYCVCYKLPSMLVPQIKVVY